MNFVNNSGTFLIFYNKHDSEINQIVYIFNVGLYKMAVMES